MERNKSCGYVKIIKKVKQARDDNRVVQMISLKR